MVDTGRLLTDRGRGAGRGAALLSVGTETSCCCSQLVGVGAVWTVVLTQVDKGLSAGMHSPPTAVVTGVCRRGMISGRAAEEATDWEERVLLLWALLPVLCALKGMFEGCFKPCNP